MIYMQMLLYVTGAVIFHLLGQRLMITSPPSEPPACRLPTADHSCSVSFLCVWRGEEDSISVISPSFLTSINLIHYTDLCPSLFPGDMYVSICVLCVCLNSRAIVSAVGCAKESLSWQKWKFQKHLQYLKSQQLWESGAKKNSMSVAAVFNILDFKGDTAGAQRKIILIGHRLSFSLRIETCAGRYSYIDTVQAEVLHHTGWTLKMISPHVFWLEQRCRSKSLPQHFFSNILWKKFLVSQLSRSEFYFLLSGTKNNKCNIVEPTKLVFQFSLKETAPQVVRDLQSEQESDKTQKSTEVWCFEEKTEELRV